MTSSVDQPLSPAIPAPQAQVTMKEPPNPRRLVKQQRPNYAHIHRQPLPLQTHSIPAFHPTNPLSLFRLVYTYLSQVLSPPTSHPSASYVGYYSPETGAIHITDPLHVRALWEMGFFGKGTLSRSEPSWMDREKARLQARRRGGMTAEEATNARRAKRRDFKLERARLEAERISRQRDVEEGRISAEDAARLEQEAEAAALLDAEKAEKPSTKQDAVLVDGAESEDEEPEVENQEHLQLTPEEAFFLSYALGVLDVRTPPRIGDDKIKKVDSVSLGSAPSLLRVLAPTAPDSDAFLLNYAVYHHFRSLGWVVRPGIKFGVDYLLYYRGPVFSHAEFAIIIIPICAEELETKKPKDWWWLHCVNRVQSQVLKSLVLCYVDVPSRRNWDREDIGWLLKRYKIREFIVRRWVANRMRD